MMSYRLSREALADLEYISDWIGARNLDAAVEWLEKMNALFALIGTQSDMGERCDQIRPGLRCTSTGNYVIYFQYASEVPEIVRILHGMRDIQRLP